MKTDNEIRTRLRALVTQEFERRVSESRARLPHLCTHNHRQPLDVRKQVEGEVNPSYNRVTQSRHLPVVQTLGLCMLGSEDPEEWQGSICEDPIDAQRCPFFNPKKTPQAILDEFVGQMATPQWIAEHMPEAATLFWVLEQATTPVVPWWRKLWAKLFRMKVEPILTAHASHDLLPEAHADNSPRSPS